MNIQDILNLLRGNDLEVTIRLRLLEGEKRVAIRCDKCNWWNHYPDDKTAKRALRSHQQHCTANGYQSTTDEPETWISAMHNGKDRVD